MDAYVYILKGQNNKFYIGSTINLQRRLRQHELGHTQTTKNMKVITLVFNQKYTSLKQARIIERRIKNLKRRDYVEKIISDGYIKMS